MWKSWDVTKLTYFDKSYKYLRKHTNAYFSSEKHVSVMTCAFPRVRAQLHRRRVSLAHGFLARACETLKINRTNSLKFSTRRGLLAGSLRIKTMLRWMLWRRKFVHAFVHSLVGSFIHSLVGSFIHSFIHSFIRSFIHWFINQEYIHTCMHT